jgi:hypothetical protein
VTRYGWFFLLLFACPVGAALADPPKLTIPAEIKADPGEWVLVVPDTTAKAVTYVSLDGLAPFPTSELKDPRKLIVTTGKAGRYRFTAVGSLNDEHASASFTIVVGGAGTTPVKPTPTDPPTDPPDTPDPKPTAYYFLIVRPDGPASAEFTRTMGLPAWDALRKAGHLVKDKTLAEAVGLGLSIPGGTTLPTVVTLVQGETKSKVVRDPVPLPTTDAAVQDLPKGVKK